jgi:hypothetical protein
MSSVLVDLLLPPFVSTIWARVSRPWIQETKRTQGENSKDSNQQRAFDKRAVLAAARRTKPGLFGLRLSFTTAVIF